jgi:hypothetical protein
MLRNLTLIYQQASDFDSLIEINDQQMILGGGPPPFETLITGVEVRAASTQYEEAIEICDILMALPALPQPVLARSPQNSSITLSHCCPLTSSFPHRR